MIFKKFNKKVIVPNWLKYTFYTLGCVFAAIYALFLFALPNLVDINKFTPQIQDEVTKLSGFGFELKNPKLKTNWKFGISVGADEIALKYKDGTNFVNLISPSIEINLPTLVLGHLNLDKIYTKEADLALVFTKEKKYTLEEHINNILKATQKPATQEQESAELPIELRNINIIAHNIKATLRDENIGKTFIANADGTRISMPSLNGPLKFKTQGYLGVVGAKENFIDFKVNLDTKLPELGQTAPKKDEEPINFALNFNPLAGLDLFALRSNVNADLKISEIGEKFKAKGFVNIDKVSIKINNTRLPESHIKTVFSGGEINSDAKIFISGNEFLNGKSKINVGKKSKILLSANTDKISLNNVMQLLKSSLDMFAIKNDLSGVSAKGYLTSDFEVESNFKTMKSKGALNLHEGEIKYPKIGVNLTQISSNLDFNNNKLTIKDTKALLNGAKFDVSGTLDTNSDINLKVNSDPLKIADIVKLGTQFGLVKQKDIQDYEFNNGTLLLSILINGTLQKIVPQVNVNLDNFAMRVKSLNLPVNIEKITAKAQPEGKDFEAVITVKNLIANLKNPSFRISTPIVEIKANGENIELAPFNLTTQGTVTKISGVVSKYMTKPQINIDAQGRINPQTVMVFIPQANRSLVSAMGQMPFSATVKGEPADLKIDAKLNSNAQNYISIVDIKNIKGLNNALNAQIELKNDDLILQNVSVVSNGSKIATVGGKISKIYSKYPQFNPINLVVPQKLQIAIPALGKISLNADANLSITGNTLKPVIVGEANVSNLNYPEFKTTVANAYADFKKSTISLRADGIKVAGSDFAGDLVALSDFSKGFVINNINFNSNYIDTDALLGLMAQMPNTQTTAGPTVGATIKAGKGKIAKLKSGTLYPDNISFDLTLYDNLFTLKNLVSGFYDGKISGLATYNIASTKVTVDGTAKGINLTKAAPAFNISSLILSGSANGLAKLNFRGTTWEQQMNTLNGQVKFDVTNGQLGESTRFERFLQAGNVLTQSLLNLNLNQTISAVSGRNTGEFKKLEGTLSITNGWANVTSFNSQGPNMSLYATGKYNILTGYTDMKILGRISSVIVSVLGPIGDFSIEKVVSKLPTKGIAIIETVAKAINPTKPLFADIAKTDLAKIPALTNTNTTNARDFQVLITGPVTKVSSIKSFKWAQKEETASY